MVYGPRAIGAKGTIKGVLKGPYIHFRHKDQFACQKKYDLSSAKSFFTISFFLELSSS